MIELRKLRNKQNDLHGNVPFLLDTYQSNYNALDDITDKLFEELEDLEEMNARLIGSLEQMTKERNLLLSRVGLLP